MIELSALSSAPRLGTLLKQEAVRSVHHVSQDAGLGVKATGITNKYCAKKEANAYQYLLLVVVQRSRNCQLGKDADAAIVAIGAT